MQRTKTGRRSLGQTVDALHGLAIGPLIMKDAYIQDVAKSAVYHINKLRKIIHGHVERYEDMKDEIAQLKSRNSDNGDGNGIRW